MQRRGLLISRLNKYMTEANLTMKMLSERSAVPLKTLYGWRIGRSPRDFKDLEKVATALGCTPEDLTEHASLTESSKYLGNRLREMRIQKMISVAKAAQLNSVSKNKIVALESDGAISLVRFVELLKNYGYNELDGMNLLKELFNNRT